MLLLVYCLIAGVVPVWLLLQPRGHLGGYFLYAALTAGGVGVLFGGFEIQYDGFKGWDAPARAANCCSRSCSSPSPAAPAPAFIR